ncbi:CsbD family protein [Paracoccus sp. 1_MG-2023]|uniref:CsbD family protein n=1 Tax=unclassified Paracoccus (in: a-proteobacteria) TaxID=2688777 RepID=UPI001C0A27F2|nr:MULTISPECIES: CsbD family protein [unclassified Paracoccus (in: a-proteobacteria)]MBU2958138.1 CsbD family protein [Paracoccus sp. C2R09]MDO6669276.1 CsbD family protein [Paracoccus sp. 1_MG-2023]
MNWDIIQGKWSQVKGSLREKWGELTEDDVDQLDGNKDQLSGKLQEKYGWAKADADREIDEYFRDK